MPFRHITDYADGRDCTIVLMIGFLVVIVFYSGIAGGLVGMLWALAVGGGVISGFVWGAGLEALIFAAYGVMGTSGGRITYKEGIIAVGWMLLPVNAIAGAIALIVWGIRALL